MHATPRCAACRSKGVDGGVGIAGREPETRTLEGIDDIRLRESGAPRTE
jgi:hypothetical protein